MIQPVEEIIGGSKQHDEVNDSRDTSLQMLTESSQLVSGFPGVDVTEEVSAHSSNFVTGAVYSFPWVDAPEGTYSYPWVDAPEDASRYPWVDAPEGDLGYPGVDVPEGDFGCPGVDVPEELLGRSVRKDDYPPNHSGNRCNQNTVQLPFQFK